MKAENVKYSGKSKAEDGSIEDFSGEVNINLPETLEEAKELWGEDVCFTNLKSAIVIKYQAIARGCKGDDAEAQAAVNAYIPGTARSRSTGGISQKAIIEKLKNLDDNTRAAILEELGLS